MKEVARHTTVCCSHVGEMLQTDHAIQIADSIDLVALFTLLVYQGFSFFGQDVIVGVRCLDLVFLYIAVVYLYWGLIQAPFGCSGWGARQ